MNQFISVFSLYGFLVCLAGFLYLLAYCLGRVQVKVKSRERLHRFSLNMLCFCLGAFTMTFFLAATFIGDLFAFNLFALSLVFGLGVSGCCLLYMLTLPPDWRSREKDFAAVDEMLDNKFD